VEIEIRWDKSGTEPADDCTLFYGTENKSHHLGTGFFTCMGILSVCKRVEFVSE
jgi:hypothetical protein